MFHYIKEHPYLAFWSMSAWVVNHFGRVWLWNPMGLPGCFVHGTLQARTLEWVAMPSSRGSSQRRDQTYFFYVSCTGMQVLDY